MNFKFTIKGDDANVIQKYLNSIPDSDIFDYQRTFVGRNAEFELIDVRNKDVFDSIIQVLKSKNINPKIQENIMTSRQIKLVENFIRRQVRRVLNERHVQIEYEDGFGDIHYLSTVVSDDVDKATKTYKHALKNDKKLLNQITKKVGETVDMSRIVGTFVD